MFNSYSCAFIYLFYSRSVYKLMSAHKFFFSLFFFKSPIYSITTLIYRKLIKIMIRTSYRKPEPKSKMVCSFTIQRNVYTIVNYDLCVYYLCSYNLSFSKGDFLDPMAHLTYTFQEESAWIFLIVPHKYHDF